MQKLNQSFQKNLHLFSGLIVLLIISFIVGKNFHAKFYGFEYEDAFINAHIASNDGYFEYVGSFRTEGCSKLLNGKCISTSSYTGHYMPYSLYLYITKEIFKPKNYQIHKIGNAILICSILIGIFFSFKEKGWGLFLITLSLLSCLPFLYLINSALIENLSMFLGLVLFTILGLNVKCNKFSYKIVALLLILVLTLVKRENLIYLGALVFFVERKDLFKYWFIAFVLIFICIQSYINPFFTEGLESEHLNQSTFSFKYFSYQFPTYLASFGRWDGFLVFILLIFGLSKPTKFSMYSIIGGITLLLLYSFHYRGQYSIIQEKISHFETFRYMSNIIPFIFGYFIFSKSYKANKTKFIVMFISLIIIFYSFKSSSKMIQEFFADEYVNYHQINDKLNSIDNLIIYDNFVLISMLNSYNEASEIYDYKNIGDIKIKKNKVQVFIDRFNIINPNGDNNTIFYKKNDSLSTEKTTVYILSENLPEGVN